MAAYVVSLKRRQDRRSHMDAQLARIGLNANYIDAVDGAELTEAERALYHRRKALAVYGAEMSPAEIGCCLSHMAAWRRMLDEGVDVALVLEDDVDCDADLPALLRAVASGPRPAWTVLRLQSTKGEVLAASRPDAQGEIVGQVCGRSVSRIRTGVLGACGYLITREGAERLLAYARRPFMPIDQMMDRYWENGVEPHVLRPFPVRQCDAIASAIGERKTAPAQTRSQRMVRRSRRACDGVAKRLYKARQEGLRRLVRIGAGAALVRPAGLWAPSALAKPLGSAID